MPLLFLLLSMPGIFCVVSPLEKVTEELKDIQESVTGVQSSLDASFNSISGDEVTNDKAKCELLNLRSTKKALRKNS